MKGCSTVQLSSKFWSLALLALLSSSHGVNMASGRTSKSASIVLKAKWEATPILLETIIFLAEEDASIGWKFIDAWENRPKSENNCWTQILELAETLLDPSILQVLQYSLAVHEFSPRLEVFRSEALKIALAQESCAFVDFSGFHTSSLKELETALQKSEPQIDVPTLHDFDISYPKSNREIKEIPTAILYGSPGEASFSEFHKLLVAYASQGIVRYGYRPFLSQSCLQSLGQSESCLTFGAGGKLQLPGFGVEMAIKNMEYSALDEKKVAEEQAKSEKGALLEEDLSGFNFRKLVEQKPELKEELLDFRDYLLASSSQEETLKVWDLKDLGLQATQRIMRSSDSLRSLTDLSQNFPNLVSSLSKSPVSNELRGEIKANQAILPPGQNFLILNGLQFHATSDLYELLQRIKTEVQLSRKLRESGIKEIILQNLLSLRADQGKTSITDTRVNFDGACQVSYLNDLEKEYKRYYVGWDRSLNSMLSIFPGTLPRLARNVLNLVYVIDPGTNLGIRMAVHAYELAMARRWPVRVGILLSPSNIIQQISSRDIQLEENAIKFDTGDKIALIFHWLEQQLQQAGSFLAQLEEYISDNNERIRIPDSQLNTLLQKFEGESQTTIEEIMKSTRGFQSLVSRASEVSDLGILENANSMWLNGFQLPEAQNLQASLGYGIQLEMGRLQELVYYGQLNDDIQDIPDFLSKTYGAITRFNPRLLEKGEGSPQLDLIGDFSPQSEYLRTVKYFHSPGTEDELKTITHWIVVDVANKEGRDLALQALQYLQSPLSANSRIGFVLLNPKEDTNNGLIQRIFQSASLLPSRRAKAIPFLIKILQASETLSEDEALKVAESSGLNVKDLELYLTDKETRNSELQNQRHFAREILRLEENENVIITNGRVIKTQSPGSKINKIIAADFLLLDNFAANSQMSNDVGDTLTYFLSQGKPVLRKNKSSEIRDSEEEETSEEISDSALIASSVLAKYLSIAPNKGFAHTRKLLEMMGNLGQEETYIQIPGSENSPLSITAILDPLSKTAQQLSGILTFLRQIMHPTIQIHLNPASDLTKLPLTSYYRLALPKLEPSLKGGFDNILEAPSAFFNGLPSSKILTLHMDVPESWLVEPIRAAYDLDNLRLSDLHGSDVLTAEFELEALLMTGSCVDLTAIKRGQVHPRGVQLHLGTETDSKLVDTLVMSNLGYFQLKTGPGSYNLTLAPGKSQDLYAVTSSDSDQDDRKQLPVAVDSFAGKYLTLNLRKLPEFELEDVLDVPIQGKKGWFDAYKFKQKNKEKLSPEDDPDTIHIFTIASGHMYERLQKIMILSLIRNTKNHVKVWFIKNYMSPQMKRFLPHMAEKYDFDYEFVTYKWPSWLHKQTDKQRIIWAYKILFLDVLFPLNLKKVIFVDSDQIIRADFAELWNMDLQGAPLAYTPFCDNNKEMDGFRFWKQGFWQNHLQGRPYHISALYVVDLQKFRQMAAGDQLRVVYENLSKDPNSLANLDQDLPNYAQSSVPIFSLPQEWLWCETWCGNSTKHRAKTIDLCNNPLTKEPKLKSARRIAPEWIELDEEAQKFTVEIEAKLQQQAIETGTEFDSGELQLSSNTQEAQLSGISQEELSQSSSETSDILASESSGDIRPDRDSEKSAELEGTILEGSDDALSEHDLSETEKLMAGLAQEAKEFHSDERTKHNAHDPTEL